MRKCLFVLLPWLLFSCSLMPQPKKISIEYLPANVIIHVNQDLVVTAVITPEDAAAAVDVSYVSEDEEVATVNFTKATIIVHGKSPGITRIRSQAEGQTEFSFLVTVQEESITINLDKNSAVLCTGQQMVLEADLAGGDPLAYDRIVWSVENNRENIVLLGSGQSITVIAYTPGLVKIVATVNDKRAVCDVLVQTSTSHSNAYITSYTSSITLDTGKDKQLSVELVNGAIAEEQNLIWAVDNPGIVHLMGQGATAMITGQAGGQTRVRVYHPQEPSLFFNFYIRVNSLLKSISLNKTGVILTPGQATTITATVMNGTENDAQNLVWSLPPDVQNTVTLIGYGPTVSVLANNTGFAKINVTLPGDIIAYCDILVSDNAAGNNATKYITADETTIAINFGRDIVLTANLVNGTPLEQNGLSWTSADPALLTLTGGGTSVILTPVAPGNTRIIISHPAAINTFSIFVKINDALSSISLNVTGLTLEIGDEYLLRAVCRGTVMDYNSITWSAEPDDQNVVSILGNGESVTLLANNPGEVRITVRTVNGSSAACDVMVRENKSISLSPSLVALKTGQSEMIQINKSPANLQLTVSCTNQLVISYQYNEAAGTIAVTGKQAGSSSIQVSGGGIMARVDCIITEDKFFDIDRLSLNIQPNATGSFRYTVQPANDQIIWAIADPDLASYRVTASTQTVTITPIREGSTSITGRTTSGLSRTVNLNFWYQNIDIKYTGQIIGGDNDSKDAIAATYLNLNNSKIYCGERVRLQIDLSFPQPGLRINGAITWNESADFREDLQLEVLNSGRRITLYLVPKYTTLDHTYDGGLLTFTVNYGNNQSYSRTFSIEVFIEGLF